MCVDNDHLLAVAWLVTLKSPDLFSLPLHKSMGHIDNLGIFPIFAGVNIRIIYLTLGGIFGAKYNQRIFGLSYGLEGP